MMSARFLVTCSLLALLVGCASQGGGRTTASRDLPDDWKPTRLKVPQEEVPEPVKAIEGIIDRKGALVADEVVIDCSRNYEWDVSLVGHDVTPQRPEGDGFVSEASGNARAQFRNLEIRAYEKITFRKSGFDVVPYIRILARGHAAYVTLPDGAASPAVRRAGSIRIDNDTLLFDGKPADPARLDRSGGADRGAVRPVGLRDR